MNDCVKLLFHSNGRTAAMHISGKPQQLLMKTNVMRVLDQKKVAYSHHCYADTGAISGAEVAEALHQDPNRAFKTLVTTGKSKTHYVFMVPVLEELDLNSPIIIACFFSIGYVLFYIFLICLIIHIILFKTLLLRQH